MNKVKDFFQAIDNLPFKPQQLSFEDLISMFTLWASTTGFPEATANSSLQKLKTEIEEIEWELFPGSIRNRGKYGEDLAEEYVDALMCIFDSANRAGLGTKDIVHAFKLKLEKNMHRKWQKNDDNTYSHIKQ